MISIGLTGGIGSGKSEAARLLLELGAVVVDADKLGHAVYRPGTDGWRAVVAAFGQGVVQPDGAVDRKKLGALVFSDSSAIAKLNSITWPAIAGMIQEEFTRLAARGVKVAVLEAAVLVEAGWARLVDEVWVVTAPEELCIKRLQGRDGLTADAVRARISAQPSDQERVKHAHAVIRNDGGLAQLREHVQELWETRIQRRIGAHVH